VQGPGLSCAPQDPRCTLALRPVRALRVADDTDGVVRSVVSPLRSVTAGPVPSEERPSLGDAFDRTLRGARRGRQRAWDALYRDLAPPLLGYLRAQRAPDPEDLVGEVFVEVVRSLHRFEGDEAGFRSWMFTIAHRRLIDARRASQRRPVELAAAEDLEPTLPPADDEPLLLERAGTAEVLALLDRLGDDQREVLVLRLVAGFTTAEVAEVTGRSTEAVKGLAKRGLARLRVLVGEARDEPGTAPGAAPNTAGGAAEATSDAQQADTADAPADPAPPSGEPGR
jgi:RNA polymerase sigma factor (sigma-70 family)